MSTKEEIAQNQQFLHLSPFFQFFSSIVLSFKGCFKFILGMFSKSSAADVLYNGKGLTDIWAGDTLYLVCCRTGIQMMLNKTNLMRFCRGIILHQKIFMSRTRRTFGTCDMSAVTRDPTLYHSCSNQLTGKTI